MNEHRITLVQHNEMFGIDKIECGFAIHHATKLAGHGPDYR